MLDKRQISNLTTNYDFDPLKKLNPTEMGLFVKPQILGVTYSATLF